MARVARGPRVDVVHVPEPADRSKLAKFRVATPHDIKARLAHENPDAIVYDDLDNAIVGVAYRCGMTPVLAYSQELIIDVLVSEQGLDVEDAWDHFSYNIAGGHLGEHTPILVSMEAF